jgi:hypothetical protein
MAIKYAIFPLNRSRGHKIFQHFPLQGLPKFSQIGILGLKINHLATLHFTEMETLPRPLTTFCAIQKKGGELALTFFQV